LSFFVKSVKQLLALLAARMVADVTETRNVIPSLEFKTWTTKKSWICRKRNLGENLIQVWLVHQQIFSI